MKKGKLAAVFLAIVFLVAGGYILEDATRHPGQFAEEWILMGALLSAFSLAAMEWFVRLHGHAKAMHRHMRRH